MPSADNPGGRKSAAATRMRRLDPSRHGAQTSDFENFLRTVADDETP